MNERFGICNLAVIPLRAEASDTSEMVSQLLFGDHFTILDEAEKWIYLKNASDDYLGWIDKKQFAEIAETDYNQLDNPLAFVCSDLLNPIQDANKGIHHIPVGCTLPNFDGNSFMLGSQKFLFLGRCLQMGHTPIENIESIAQRFINTPYLWGGKSPLGIDCSGFTQLVFKMMGKKLKRDARQQAEQGQLVDFLEESKTGDLAFFDNEEGNIIHVGLLLENGRIMHASGKVRIDKIDHQGIFNTETKRYSHKLRIIKRVF